MMPEYQTISPNFMQGCRRAVQAWNGLLPAQSKESLCLQKIGAAAAVGKGRILVDAPKL
jgi:hypothetical protein